MGEPGGVGAEIAAKAWRALASSGPAFFLIGDPARFAEAGAPVEAIEHPSEAGAVFKRAAPVLDIGARVDAAPGRARAETAPLVVNSIERAVSLTLAGDAAAVVTNPIQKSALFDAGFSFPGHTEYLDALTANAPLAAGAPRGPVMTLAGPDLKTPPVTVHQSVRDAAAVLSADMIVRKARVVAHALRQDFGVEQPRLAVSGLNPHAGEAGAMGREDIDVIAPAIAALRAEGVDAFGPAPADTLFHAAARARYDAALCMLHDQALIPVKTLAFDETVNVTLGLPIVRTSPDHGAALDIAGRGLARPDSLIAAIRLARRLADRRRAAA